MTPPTPAPESGFAGRLLWGVLLFFYQAGWLASGLVILGARLLTRRPVVAIRSRLGWYSAPVRERLAQMERPIWLHMVSVGEVIAARPLIEALRARFPERSWVFTTVTPTGQKMARKMVREGKDLLLYLPWDLGPVVRRVIGWIRPALFLCLETELWPVLFTMLNRRGVPIVIVNGRVSPRALRRYLWVRPFMQRLLSRVAVVMAQSPQDARRYASIGAAKDRIVVTGNLKWDLETFEGQGAPSGRVVRTELGVAPDQLLWTAGSTHPGEEPMLLRTYGELKRSFPMLRLLIAPRHPERSDRIEGLAQRMGFSVQRRSRTTNGAAAGGDSILLLDTLGELNAVYAASDLVFVGGSLVPWGGHNLVEPAARRRAILTGPHLQNFQAISEALIQAQAIAVVPNATELSSMTARFLRDPALRSRLGEQAFRVIEAHRGALDRTVGWIAGRYPAAG